MANDKDEVVDSLKKAISKDPKFRLATDEEVKALLEESKEEREKQQANMDRPEYGGELKKTKESWYAKARVQTPESLPRFIAELIEHKHDYKTIVYAVAAAAVGAAWVVDQSPNGGITGFQVGAVFWEFYSRWTSAEGPARLVKYENMLFPQYADSFEKTLSPNTWKWLRQEAAKKLSEELAADRVSDHWRSIVAGNVPFGYTVKED